MTGIIATMAHVRAATMCAGGARQWCKRNGIPWQQFLDHGLPVEFLEQSKDPLALQVAAKAREDAENGR